MTADKRRIRVNAANLRNRQLYVTKQLLDFFPKDAVGGPRRKSANGHGFDLILDGLGETVRTDIGSDGKNGKARGFLRCRGMIKRFYKHHAVQSGAVVVLQRLAERPYRLGPAPRSPSPASDWCGWRWRGRDVVLASDIDPDNAEMYRHNWPKNFHLVFT